MTRRALSVVATVLAVAAVASATPVRFFAVGNKQRLVDGTSYQTFRDKMAALMDGAFTINAAPARRVEDTIEPERVALLRDPDEPARQYAYEAVSPLAVNTTFIFTPMGDLLVSDGEGGTRRSPAETGGVLAGATKKAEATTIAEPPPGDA